MHILLTLLLSFTATLASASDEKAIKELLINYDKVMTEHKTELVDEVFTKKFLSESGGKEEFIEKIKELPKVKKKSKIKRILESWKKSKIGNMLVAKVKKDVSTKSSSNFVIIEEDGKLKIDGTISDDE
jgi:hypothetical protein